MIDFWFATISVIAGAFLITKGVLLFYRKIPRKLKYGYHFPHLDKTNAQWYEVNQFGGKTLAICIFPYFLLGIIGLIDTHLFGEFYWVVSISILFLGVSISAYITYRKTLTILKRDAEQDAAANP